MRELQEKHRGVLAELGRAAMEREAAAELGQAAEAAADAQAEESPQAGAPEPPSRLSSRETTQAAELDAKLDRELAKSATRSESVLEARAEAVLAGRFSRARRRQYHAHRRKRRALILHPQRIYPAMRELTRRPGGPELVGRYQIMCERRGWHPTDVCALRRFVALLFGLDVAKPYNWGPRARRRRGLGLLGDSLGHDGTYGLSMRGVGQEYIAVMLASGDGIPVTTKTVAAVFADLADVGLCSAHQPPPGAKLAPYERHGRYAFNQYWFALAGMVRKPNMRGELDAIVDWAERIAAWFAALAHGPQPAS